MYSRAAAARQIDEGLGIDSYLFRYDPPILKPRMRLFLFPYAGGNALVFRDWPQYFDAHHELIGIQLPGRATRWREQTITQPERLTHQVADAIEENSDGARFVFFGHSMGAMLAFHVAEELIRRGTQAPEALFLSGRKALHLPVEKRRDTEAMSDEAFLGELRRLDGTPQALLDNEEMMKLMLPTIKADFTLLDNWQDLLPETPPGKLLLCCPIFALTGRRDRHCSHEQAAQWREYTHGTFESLEYSGGHFFIHSHQRQVVTDVRERMNALMVAV